MIYTKSILPHNIHAQKKKKLKKLNARTYLEINSKHVSETGQRHLNGLVQIPLLVSLPLLYLLLQKSVGFSLLHSGRNRVESAVVACIKNIANKQDEHKLGWY